MSYPNSGLFINTVQYECMILTMYIQNIRNGLVPFSIRQKRNRSKRGRETPRGAFTEFEKVRDSRTSL